MPRSYRSGRPSDAQSTLGRLAAAATPQGLTAGELLARIIRADGERAAARMLGVRRESMTKVKQIAGVKMGGVCYRPAAGQYPVVIRTCGQPEIVVTGPDRYAREV